MPSIMTKAGYTPPKQQRPEPPQKKKPVRKKRKTSKAAVVSLVIFLIAVLIGSVVLYVYAQTQPYQLVFAPGTILSGMPLMGMSVQQAEVLLSQMTQEKLSSWQAELVWQEQHFTLTAQDVSLRVDAQATLSPLWAVGKEDSLFERYLSLLSARTEPILTEPVLQYDMDAVDAMLMQVKEAVDTVPVNAAVDYVPRSSTPFRFTKEEVGYALDCSPLRSQIESALAELTPIQETLSPQVLEPAVYAAALEAAITLRARVVMPLSADEASLTNARLAVQALADLRLEPGETLSLNDVVGMRTAAAGYVSAPEPAYGEGISGVGGGVCQVSTALYRTALLADLYISQRNAAVYPVDYCEIGQEAAVSDQGLDLCIVNSTESPLFLTARIYADGEQQLLEMQCIGEPLAQRCTLESLALETEMPEEPVYVRDSEGRYAKYTDERIEVGTAKAGYSVCVQRVMLDAQGNETGRETVSQDVYDAMPQRIYVGVTPR